MAVSSFFTTGCQSNKNLQLIVKLVNIIFCLLFGFAPLYAQQRGKASYYSKRATGNKSSSGEKIHHDSLTCAHRTFPFGTLLKVTNLRNGMWTVVRVIDRGPYVRGRIIDLSYRAAHEIGMLSSGIIMVEVEQYHERITPYKPEEHPYRPIEFDIAEMGIDDVHPVWVPDTITHPKPVSQKKLQSKGVESKKTTSSVLP